MPLWKIYHPAGAYTDDDKNAFSKSITSLYEMVPIPKFYVVCVFEEMPAGTIYVGGERNDQFVRIRVDQIARTMPGQIVREWWVGQLERVIGPWVRERGYDWELSVDETPFDLWSLQGEIPPPFESIAEKRWVAENKALSYSQAEKLPASMSGLTTPGVTG
jgi:phenylpyruvate tautomerase PptA (4-oxalocrotonate tautomerase family)